MSIDLLKNGDDASVEEKKEAVAYLEEAEKKKKDADILALILKKKVSKDGNIYKFHFCDFLYH